MAPENGDDPGAWPSARTCFVSSSPGEQASRTVESFRSLDSPLAAAELPRHTPTCLTLAFVSCLSYCYHRTDPLDAANASFIDNGYPHTHMRPQLVRAVLLAHELQHRANVTFWLECGSMLGGSLIRTAQVARRLDRYDGLSLVASEWPALSNLRSRTCMPWAGLPTHPQVG